MLKTFPIKVLLDCYYKKMGGCEIELSEKKE